METIEIQILAQDVRNAGNFLDVNNCILATASFTYWLCYILS
jgi:hypothetical protein